MDRRVVGVLGVDIPEVLLHLTGDPFLPAFAELPTFLLGVFEPAAVAGAQAVGCVLRSLRRIEIEIGTVARDRLFPASW